MSFLDYNLNDVPDLHAKEEGEYELRIIDAEIKTIQKVDSAWYGAQMVLVKMDIPEDPNSKDITHTIFLPKEGDTEKEMAQRLRGLKIFCDAFGYDYSNGINVEDLKGLTGWALLKVEESDEYGEQNRVKRFVIGK